MNNDPLLPPGSGPLTARLNGHRLTLLGWGRAILMQLAHPLIAAGVRDHSHFDRGALSPLVRLHATVRAMLALSFGTEAERQRAADGINAIHDRVHGTLPHAVGPYPAGAAYSAHDPELLCWVYLTLLDSTTRAYAAVVRPLDDREIASYCLESREGAGRLGLPSSRVPDSREALQRAIDDTLASGVIHVGDTARLLGRRILHPPLAGLLGPLQSVHRLTTIGWLPPSIRAGYALAWTGRDEQRLELWTRRLRRLSSMTPDVLTRWPAARRAEREWRARHSG